MHPVLGIQMAGSQKICVLSGNQSWALGISLRMKNLDNEGKKPVHDLNMYRWVDFWTSHPTSHKVVC